MPLLSATMRETWIAVHKHLTITPNSRTPFDKIRAVYLLNCSNLFPFVLSRLENSPLKRVLMRRTIRHFSAAKEADCQDCCRWPLLPVRLVATALKNCKIKTIQHVVLEIRTPKLPVAKNLEELEIQSGSYRNFPLYVCVVTTIRQPR